MLGFGEMGIGNSTAASALTAALTGLGAAFTGMATFASAGVAGAEIAAGS